ncbi:putative membrane protein [Barrientosiimonas humi]|uniref:Putative membrane protein n=1 Tax=Barrientosiimonas humi TaxID=999931 RepID=A0A542X9Z1_9MICO|nr:DUF2306 domain-containing protein [Barrientosiimonas humi]TQL32655.1 putative membrane protein [Barrientosiimonas humi]CAG7572646.1 hypothetical protein BH39T_PBIAJDOK_01269 [Barrientosiimonas humi]
MSGWTPLLVSHVLAASVSMPLGAYQLWRRPRGDLQHRIVGRVWAGLMMWTALSSYAIRDIRPGQLSLLHILSTVTVVSLVIGIWAVRRGDVRTHLGAMRGSWLGSIGAFVGAVAVPDRLLPTFAVTNPAGFAAATATVLVVSALIVAVARASVRGADEPGRVRAG